MAASESEIRNIASYLCVTCGNITINQNDKSPALNTEGGSPIKGLTSIIKYLAQKANKKSLLGGSPEDEALINQWLEYRVCYLERCEDSKELEKTLKEMNDYLGDKVYFVGNSLTLADLVLFQGLSEVYNHLNFFEKQKYMHLSRWYNQMQNTRGVKQKLPTIFFQKNLIYTGSAH